MKKIIAIAIIGLAGLTLAQEEQGVTYSSVGAVNGVTNYFGITRATINGVASTNDAKWKIIKTVYDASGNVLSVQHAYNPTLTGDAQVWGNSFTNYASTNTAVIIYR